METYADRQRVSEGQRGASCAEPGCGCGGWVSSDPEHMADHGGSPAHAYYAAWVPRDGYVVTAHWARVKCSDKGCEHDRLIVNGGQVTVPPLKVFLVSEPGAGRVWRKLSDGEAAALTSGMREHAAKVLASQEGGRL